MSPVPAAGLFICLKTVREGSDQHQNKRCCNGAPEKHHQCIDSFGLEVVERHLSIFPAVLEDTHPLLVRSISLTRMEVTAITLGFNRCLHPMIARGHQQTSPHPRPRSAREGLAAARNQLKDELMVKEACGEH